MVMRSLILALLVCAAAAAPVADTILKLTHWQGVDCSPSLSPRTVEMECMLNRTMQAVNGGPWVMCNCTVDKQLIVKYTFNAATGIYTYAGNFSTGMCISPGTMYMSVQGMCGGGDPYDTFLAQQAVAYAGMVQHGPGVNAKLSAGLFDLVAFLVWVFVM